MSQSPREEDLSRHLTTGEKEDAETFARLMGTPQHGYHLKEIEKGVFGEFSKIVEEFTELEDAHKQGNKVMELVEVSDLLGAISAYLDKGYGGKVSLLDCLKMTEATRRAFESGVRR